MNPAVPARRPQLSYPLTEGDFPRWRAAAMERYGAPVLQWRTTIDALPATTAAAFGLHARFHGRHDLAVAFMLAASKDGPMTGYLTTLGASLRHIGRVDDAARVLLLAATQSSVVERRKPLTSYAALMSDIGDYAAARTLLLDLRAQHPDDPCVLRALARATRCLGERRHCAVLVAQATSYHAAADALPAIQRSDGGDDYFNELQAFAQLGAAGIVERMQALWDWVLGVDAAEQVSATQGLGCRPADLALSDDRRHAGRVSRSSAGMH
jgi:hypothetical protein